MCVQIARRPMRQLREETALAEDVKETTAAREANFKWAGTPETRVCKKTYRRRSVESALRGPFYIRAMGSSRVYLRYGMRMKGVWRSTIQAQSFW